mmetsp:Transcript_15837/g.30993  ORF Transcript_15837/g.30993 Transcript_15837/m.30993 type:complete len:731 (-) Transcript_15837:61-2253(-)|eukprot:CAMPEP_0175101944 /NCGR_PEP_ID=MMETSP0086_2-20121207/8130_1 /TAXON_ID=136419 /ORGANISM="Unknown Unknown, Strain D1" /LENGTH=730 /DNA_ID=CAMNT_0016376635 /DNA_START=37 /DNA_END=2229 /DNA_ORIENTATION=+
MSKAGLSYPNYVEDRAKCRAFLEGFTQNGSLKYMDKLQEISNRELKRLVIELDDVEAFEADSAFMQNIIRNCDRYLGLFASEADSLMPEPSVEIKEEDVYDVWMHHRQQRIEAAQRAQVAAGEEAKLDALPARLTRRYDIAIAPLTSEKPLRLREVKSRHIGNLVQLTGIVTRITDVQPRLAVAAYICNTCGFESYQEISSSSYMPLAQCPSPVCKANGSSGNLVAQTRGSKFVRFQELKLQEQPAEVPVGHVPRSITCRIVGEMTRSATPGNVVTVSGVFLPIKLEGFRAMRAGLTADTYLDITSLVQHKKSYTDYTLTPELLEQVEEEADSPDIYDNLAASIAPEIFGHEDIKKALILLLVGGVTRQQKDNMKIRGDINILLMGDPGVAKSQLLKHIASVAPRGIYTTGKGSSGVGLTAAVTRDNLTGETTLEGGALVLADQGICCIDEFDKMGEDDRTAIHEVMEQQSVSIAKAGITTTLNARTAVLAAANPVSGRWNRNLKPETNLGIETALLSRFDLTFVILDTPDEDHDESLARHVTYVHRENKHPELDFEPFSSPFLRAYISRARQFEPYIPEHLTEHIVSDYISLRQQKNDTRDRKAFATARALLGTLRLSQALARIHFRDEVTKDDVDEAQRLLMMASQTDQEDNSGSSSDDFLSAIYEILNDHARSRKSVEIERQSVLPKLTRAGYTEEQLDQTLEAYEDQSVLTVSADGRNIRFLMEAM